MIIVDRLTKRYGAATAVDAVTFTAAPGDLPVLRKRRMMCAWRGPESLTP